jgi:hypothetical protein
LSNKTPVTAALSNKKTIPSCKIMHQHSHKNAFSFTLFLIHSSSKPGNLGACWIRFWQVRERGTEILALWT